VNLLAVETSTELCSVALLRDGELLAEEALAENRHSEMLVAMVRRVLERGALAAASMDAFAFGQGPGSFTGIRIACGLVQGLAFGAGRLVVPVPSLLALAEQAGSDRVVAAVDARMGEAYVAAYRRDGGDWDEVLAPRLAAPGDLAWLPDEGWTAIGSGFERHPWLVEAFGGRVVRRVAGELPRAGAVARIAARRYARGAGVAAERAAPLYLRDKVALTTEERRDKKVSAVPVPQLHYRHMRMNDLAAIAQLEKSLYAFPWSLGNFRDSISAGYDCWTVTHGETVIGYAVLMIAVDEAHLLNFAIASEWQNQGIGRRFLEQIIEVARHAGCQIVYLEVRPSNLAARHLYRNMGFQQIAIRPEYYPSAGGREDALFLGRSL
jgi:tRNA threonylcarbamoyl adenosine modification protein YeaZ/ribosomal-protein-alanine acetyltransferase